MRKLMIFLYLFLFALVALSQQRVLQIWAMGEEAKKLNVMAEKFVQENPNVRVEIQAIPWSAAYDKLLTGIAGGQLPDLAQMGTTWMAPFGAIGAFEELTPYLAKSFIKKETFFDGSWQTVTMNGGVYTGSLGTSMSG